MNLARLLARLSMAVLLLITVPAPAQAPPQVCDGHHHDALRLKDSAIDTSNLAAVRARGIGAFLVPLPLERSATEDLPGRIAREVGLLRAASGQGFTLVGQPKAEGPQVFLGIEFGRGSFFKGDLAQVRRYRDLGIRLIGLPPNDPDGLFARGAEPAALTPFGGQLLDACHDAGVLVDITHLTHPQKLAVIARAKDPVVASHSLLQAATPAAFNLPEPILEALALKGGSVWVSFNRMDLLLKGEPDGLAMDRLLEHLDRLLRRLGPGRVGIGTDLQADGKYVPEPLGRPDAFARIAAGLKARGHAPADVEGVLGWNVLRSLQGDTGREPTATPKASGRF